MPDPKNGGSGDEHRRYWRTNVKIVAVLLAVWAAVSLGCGVLFVNQLNAIQLGGYKLGFWFAQQGSIYIFIALIFVYALLMDREDRAFHVEERKEDTSDVEDDA